MFLKKFKQTGPDIVILIFIISVLVWAGSFFHPPDIAQSSGVRPMPLYSVLLKLTSAFPLMSVFLTFMLLQLTGFLLVNFNTSDFFIGERTFLPALIYFLLSGIFISQQTMNPALPAAIFLIMASRRIMDSYKVQGTAFSFFDAGLLIGTGSLFYCQLAWFGFLLIIGIALLRTGNPKEIIISLLGLITPWFIVYGFLYLTGNDLGILLSDISFNLLVKEVHYALSMPELVAISVTGVIFLIGLIKLIPSLGVKKIKSRKTFSLLIWMFLITAVIYIFSHSVSVEMIWLAGIPVCFTISHYFVYARKKLVPEALFLSIIAVVAIVQLMKIF